MSIRAQLITVRPNVTHEGISPYIEREWESVTMDEVKEFILEGKGLHHKRDNFEHLFGSIIDQIVDFYEADNVTVMGIELSNLQSMGRFPYPNTERHGYVRQQFREGFANMTPTEFIDTITKGSPELDELYEGRVHIFIITDANAFDMMKRIISINY